MPSRLLAPVSYEYEFELECTLLSAFEEQLGQLVTNSELINSIAISNHPWCLCRVVLPDRYDEEMLNLAVEFGQLHPETRVECRCKPITVLPVARYRSEGRPKLAPVVPLPSFVEQQQAPVGA